MGYVEAAEKLLDSSAWMNLLLILIALAVLLVLASNALKAFREIFGKKGKTLEEHCAEANQRFEAGEKHIAENHDSIEDLQEGNRVICLSLRALLGHEMRTSNGEEMEKAQRELTTYLINRK